MEIRHRPVLLEEVLKISLVQPGELVVDGTTGEGGHSEAFLQRFPACRLVCLDADLGIQAKARERLAGFGERVRFVHAWFDEWFVEQGAVACPNVVLLDLGISVYHYEESGRGFSFRGDEPLDMRLDPSQGESAADLVNSLGEVELARVLFEYGEETLSRRIARTLVEARKQERIETAKQLADKIWEAVPVSARYGRLHPATKSFQALRIAVNGELDRLSRVLTAAFAALAPGGRLVVISFHSLEDRAVKTFFREHAKACICGPEIARCQCGGRALADDLTRRPLVATEEEVALNPPSRSAKLRAVKKLRSSRKEE
ncbi:MAG: 16S rRNA (cytosine(1402)-N(4))-methyltransferase RsmH [Spirochaetales bacterium]